MDYITSIYSNSCEESNIRTRNSKPWVDNGTIYNYSQETKDRYGNEFESKIDPSVTGWQWLSRSRYGCKVLAEGGCTSKTSKQDIGERYHWYRALMSVQELAETEWLIVYAWECVSLSVHVCVIIIRQQYTSVILIFMFTYIHSVKCATYIIAYDCVAVYTYCNITICREMSYYFHNSVHKIVMHVLTVYTLWWAV